MDHFKDIVLYIIAGWVFYVLVFLFQFANTLVLKVVSLEKITTLAVKVFHFLEDVTFWLGFW